jgi:gliding motility-associated-like protein
MKPHIVGQKELSTEQGKPITILLSDLFVEEQEVGAPAEDNEPPAESGGGGTTTEPDDSSGGGPDEGGNGQNGGDGHQGSSDDGDGKDDDSGKDHDKGHNKDKDKNKDPKDHKPDHDEHDKGHGHHGNGRTYPDGYTLVISEGDDYAVSGSTITPAATFTGVLVVGVRVKNENYSSDVFPLNITVTATTVPNAVPEITGQVPLTTSVNKPLTISLADLSVMDPDSRYPDDFSLVLFSGDHYSLSGHTVIPNENFTGDLFVSTKVSDGNAFSDAYDIKIAVTPAPNVKPVITGQAGLKVPEGQTLKIQLSHLVVEDADNQYPDEFTLTVAAGESYSVSDNRVTPAPGFLGVLTVMVTVNDGRLSSEPYGLKIEVTARGKLEIIGQTSVAIPEDSAYKPLLRDLLVSDPDETFPAGFKLEVAAGKNYEVVNGTIRPSPDFYGNLTIPLSVKNASSASPQFSFLLVVLPVNDAPEVVIESEPLQVTGTDPVSVTSQLELSDVDDDDLLFAEVGIDGYQAGTDLLTFEVSEHIHAVFEADTGVAYLFGQASLSEYQTVLRSTSYEARSALDTTVSRGSKTIWFKVSDGKAMNTPATRQLIFENLLPLDIPSAFTPNNDMANDTWKITSGQDYTEGSALIRVYDKKGNVVFQTDGFDDEWDGQLNGRPLPADVYFYTIDVSLPDRKVNRKGIVSILR